MLNKYLIVVDCQNDFIYGSLGSLSARMAVSKMKKKVDEYQSSGTVIFTQDTHGEDYLNTSEGKNLPVPHCIAGTEGWEIIPELTVAPWNERVCKHTFGVLNCESFIQNPSSIEIIGVCTDICVISNALILKARYPEIPIVVDASCCAGTSPDKHKKALDIMRSCQIEVVENNV